VPRSIYLKSAGFLPVNAFRASRLEGFVFNIRGKRGLGWVELGWVAELRLGRAMMGWMVMGFARICVPPHGYVHLASLPIPSSRGGQGPGKQDETSKAKTGPINRPTERAGWKQIVLFVPSSPRV
jgi:hypothetical protein